MQDQGNHGKDQQYMNETAGYVHYRKTADPRDQQNDEKNRPDTHFSLRVAELYDRRFRQASRDEPALGLYRHSYSIGCFLGKPIL